MIIATCGYGNTGASAVLDFYRGYDSIQLLDTYEFQFLHQPDGICDLKYHLTNSKERIGVDTAIKRYIRLQKHSFFAENMRTLIGTEYDKWWKAYIDELTCASWQGISSAYDPLDISDYVGNKYIDRVIKYSDVAVRKINKDFHLRRNMPKYFSIMSESEFDEITAIYIRKFFSLLGRDPKEKLVVDMLFSASNPHQGMEFFEDARALVVVRDPRDLYVAAKQKPERARYMPQGDVESFVKFYKLLRESVVEDESVHVIQYEDLIYKYEETAQRLMRIAGLSERPEHEYECFNPCVSVKYTNNTKLYQQYAGDIHYIENALSEYLYDFQHAVKPKDVQTDKQIYRGSY